VRNSAKDLSLAFFLLSLNLRSGAGCPTLDRHFLVQVGVMHLVNALGCQFFGQRLGGFALPVYQENAFECLAGRPRVLQ